MALPRTSPMPHASGTPVTPNRDGSAPPCLHNVHASPPLRNSPCARSSGGADQLEPEDLGIDPCPPLVGRMPVLDDPVVDEAVGDEVRREAGASLPTSTSTRPPTRPPTARRACSERSSPPAARSLLCSSRCMAATLLAVVAGTLDGESVLKGRSPFADRVGEPIASPLLTLVDDPTDPRLLGADSHDGEGLATCRCPADRGRRAPGLPPQLDDRPGLRPVRR